MAERFSCLNLIQHKVECRFLLYVVICQRPSILQLFARENKPLLVRRNAFLILNLGFDVLDRIGRFDIERYRFPRQGLHGGAHTTHAKKVVTFFW